MDRVPLLTGSRASVFWGYDFRNENLRFLEAIDHGYFEFTAETADSQLFGDAPLEKRNRLRAAMTLRTAYGQAAETMLALLCALAQAPQFPLGWLVRYQTADLREVVTAIQEHGRFHSLLTHQPVTWESLSALVLEGVELPESQPDLVAKFATFWSRIAREFLSEKVQGEYNAIKHGLRVLPGGFQLSYGIEKKPGTAAAREDMQSLGGSEFGSSFVVPLRIDGAQKHHLRLSRESLNWRPERLIIDMHLMAHSIGNTVSRLRVLGGGAGEFKFAWPGPGHEDAFSRYLQFLPGVETLSMPYRVTADLISSVSPADVVRAYEAAQVKHATKTGSVTTEENEAEQTSGEENR